MPTRFSTLLLVLLLATGLTAQSQPAKPDGPYHLSLKREASYIGLGGLMLGAGTYFQGRVPEVTISELSLNDFKQVNAIDGAYGNIIENDDARLLSDKLLNFNAGLPLALILGRRMRRDFPRIAVLYVETMAITGGLTNLTKATILRTRPYVLGPDWDPDRLLESGDRASFISGHTSISAAGTFFFARVFTDYYPESKLKPVIWVVAAGLPRRGRVPARTGRKTLPDRYRRRVRRRGRDRLFGADAA